MSLRRLYGCHFGQITRIGNRRGRRDRNLRGPGKYDHFPAAGIGIVGGSREGQRRAQNRRERACEKSK
jgi:hypothetical protein